MLNYLAAYATAYAQQIRERSRREHVNGGYSTEMIAVTAFIVALALAALAILGPKVLAKINGVTL
ncbi:hypothetical protein [Actinoplanes regularis]|uniref:Uncharacterized protein n=1 Tax=Actinoplanes regularis TaxID=52697 RepID=A0A239EXM1_9ACTN|nr:hypothetical protein [Actinoplanes regularis]GIE89732.1 hypothetical protein Are01nite_62120 [Actinoplanes regularis]SNS49369.1 hypothetical protein SAMN06264365_116163 [Actinoplanes regularis]